MPGPTRHPYVCAQTTALSPASDWIPDKSIKLGTEQSGKLKTSQGGTKGEPRK